MKAEQKSAVQIGTPKISKLGSLHCFISGGKELKPLLMNTSHLEMLMWRPKGGPRSWINFRTENKDDLGPASALSSRYKEWNSRGEPQSLTIALIRTFSTRERNRGPRGSPCCTPDLDLSHPRGCHKRGCWL